MNVIELKETIEVNKIKRKILQNNIEASGYINYDFRAESLCEYKPSQN